MKLSNFEIDAERIEVGDWVENIPDCGDLRIKTRGLNNADYRRLYETKTRAVPRKERRSGIVAETMRRIVTECVVATCLLDWNVEDVPFSKPKALELLSDPRFEPLRDACLWAASIVADQTTADREDDAKNSPADSATNAAGVGTENSSTS